jgi:DNA-directed RNA polymerase specialized sigma24 family protein
MEDAPKAKRKIRSRPVNGVEWEALLSALGSDIEYETARNGLIKIFRSKGLALEADDLTDRTLDIGAMRLKEKSETDNPIRDIHAYLRDIARKLASETRRAPKLVTLTPEMNPARTLMSDTGIEKDREKLPAREERLRRAIGALSDKERRIIMEYYQNSKSAKINGRAALARETRRSASALRVKVFRIRRRLRDAIRGEESGT